MRADFVIELTNFVITVSFLVFLIFQLHSSSSDEAISSRARKEPTPAAAATDTLTEEGVEEGTSSSSRVSIEIEEEETERIKKAQTKIK